MALATHVGTCVASPLVDPLLAPDDVTALDEPCSDDVLVTLAAFDVVVSGSPHPGAAPWGTVGATIAAMNTDAHGVPNPVESSYPFRSWSVLS